MLLPCFRPDADWAQVPRRTAAGPVAVALGLLAAAGCSAGDALPRTARAMARDSASITILETAVADAAAPSGLRLGAEPLLQIGVLEGDPDRQFSDIVALVRLDDGRIVVGDSETDDVRWFAPDGTHLATAGGRGEGPEEFRGGPYPLTVLPGDSLAVGDRLDRLVYDSDGRFLRRETGDPESLVALVGSRFGVRFADGSWLARLSEPLPVPLVPAGPAREALHFARVAPGHASADTVVRVRGSAYQVYAPNQFWSPVFYATSRASLTSRGRHYLIADGAIPEVHRLGQDGHHEILRWNERPEPITAEDEAHWIQAFVDRNPEQEIRVRESFAAIETPPFKPIVGWLVAGAQGAALIASGHPRDPSFPQVHWSLIDTDGTYLGRMDMPPGFVPFDFGFDWMLGEWRDELNVPYVRLYAIDRAP